MNHRIALLSAAIAVPLLLGAGNAQAAPAVSPEPVANSGSALLDSDLAVLLGTGSGQLARALLDAGSSRTPSNADIAASGSSDLGATGSALGNNLLTTGSAQALIGPGSAWSNFWTMLGNSGSGKGWMQGFGSSGYQNG
ncbi:hypothetical protein [Nocardia yamanashiensis]|uniref:hypothetical protein n=1 Tax=Nocardia yamanashiensis TaxID=209247 RepID=UPI00082C6C87|nr:hypothetical protein [Nocardia yamanashiensis]